MSQAKGTMTVPQTFTPGPWVDDDFYGIVAEDGTPIATYTNDDDGIHWADEQTRLVIRAAPELYAALVLMVEAMRGSLDSRRIVILALNSARAALAKADGQ